MTKDQEHAAWLADKICNGGDYAKEAAAMLCRWPEASGPWISVEDRMPVAGLLVLAFFRNTYGKGRVVRAHHAPKHTIEACHWDEDVETDDTEDGAFEPEGWYEDPAVGETLSFISEASDGKVTHWMPLPAAPAAPSTPPEALSDEQWYDIASKHAPKDWNGNGYLELVKSVGNDAIRAALAAPSTPAAAKATWSTDAESGESYLIPAPGSRGLRE